MIPPKLNFYEFVRWSAEGFEEQSSKEWADRWFKQLPNFIHEGDCTKQCHTCNLCLLEVILEEYIEYTFDYDRFIKSLSK